MECFEFGYVIKGDVNDTLKKTVEYCSDGIKQKAKVLAGYIQSDDFLEFCKKDEKFDSTKSILENKQNTVRRILKQYYELKHQDVTTAAAKRQADLLMGFSSVKARNIAINDTATIISLLYEQERKSSKYNNVKLNRVKIIQKAIDALEKDYINNVALKVYNQNKEIDDNTIKEFKRNIKIINAKLADMQDDLSKSEYARSIDNITKEILEFKRCKQLEALALTEEHLDVSCETMPTVETLEVAYEVSTLFKLEDFAKLLYIYRYLEDQSKLSKKYQKVYDTLDKLEKYMYPEYVKEVEALGQNLFAELQEKAAKWTENEPYISEEIREKCRQFGFEIESENGD